MAGTKSARSGTEKKVERDILTARSILEYYIDEQGMRKTPERYAILEAVMHMSGHHSADEIFSMMPSDFHVSRTSIYNTLKLLDELDIVASHQIHGTTLYERACGIEPHHHYICKGCNRIWDLKDAEFNEIAARCKTPRFRKTHYSMYIHGICDVCQARLNRLKKKIEQQKTDTMTREEKRFARIDQELAEAAKWL